MGFEVERGDGVLSLRRGNDRIRLRHRTNRFHDHSRVQRLSFEVEGNWHPEALHRAIRRLVVALLSLGQAPAPLLYRTTLAETSPLLDPLRSLGFVESRRVYLPVLTLSMPGLAPPVPPTEPGLVLMPLSEACHDLGVRPLVAMFIEIYCRVARLDPATPHRLNATEWEEHVLRDPDLVPELSCCAVSRGGLVGMAVMYRGSDGESFELGPFGVIESRLPQHQELTLAMVRRSIAWIRERGGLTLTAEIDSDDPWTLYTLADLPFNPGSGLVSLVNVPAWGTLHPELPSSAP